MRNPSETVLNSLDVTYTPLDKGDQEAGMGAAGYQPGIGLLPKWDALCVTSADSRACKSAKVNSLSYDSFSITWNDDTTNLTVLPSDEPDRTVEGTTGTEDLIGGQPLVYEVNHHPSEGYLWYLLSGDPRGYLTLRNNASLCYIIRPASAGSGTSRIYFGQVRGRGWCTRSLAQLAAIKRSDDSIATEYQTLLDNNVTSWRDVIDQPGFPLFGAFYSYNANDPATFPLGTSPNGSGWLQFFMQFFWMQSIGYAVDLQPLSDNTDLQYVEQWFDKAVVGLLGPNGVDNYCFTEATHYEIALASENNADPLSGYWFDTPGEVYHGTLDADNTSCGNTLSEYGSGKVDDPTSYWANIRPAIAYAVDHGVSGADAAYSRLLGADNYDDLEGGARVSGGYDDTPNWGIVPR
jgi:hypothetical protein